MAETEKVFDRETLLDLTVNVIPLGILTIFFVAYIVFNPFGFDSVISGVQLSIVGVSAILLTILTYYSGAAVSKAENRQEAALEEEDTEELEAGDETDVDEESDGGEADTAEEPADE